MNIYQLLGEKEVSNDYLAEKLRESYNRYKEYVEENTPLWRKEGVEMRNKREEQGISQRYLGELVGVSSQTIARMEQGKPVRSRKLLVTACRTIMDYIYSNQQSDIEILEEFSVQE